MDEKQDETIKLPVEFKIQLSNSDVDISGLTDDQKKAYDELIKFIQADWNPDDFIRALSGAAGTGKTYLIRAVIHNCGLSSSIIGLSAPSHKAVRVLKESVAGVTNNVMTIQSAFGFRPDYDIQNFDYRHVHFASKGATKVNLCKLFIVDEASMISKGLLEYMRATMRALKCKIILMGDAYQLPPVKEKVSAAFVGIPTCQLNKIVRQDDDNPVRYLLDLLRYDIKHRTTYFLTYIGKTKEGHDSTFTKGFNVVGASEFKSQVGLYFSNGEILKDTDYCRVIAYTNRAVSSWNKYVRNCIVAQSEKSVLTKNDLITSYNTVVDEFGSTIINNSEDYVVKDIADYIHPKYGYKGFIVSFQAIHGGATTPALFVLDHTNRQSLMEYCQKAMDLIDRAKNNGGGFRWKQFYEFRDDVMLLQNIVRTDGTTMLSRTLDYGFSITAHKAQGSTYNVALVDVNDIVFDRNGYLYNDIDEMNRRLYVACSRCKDKLIIAYGN